tara:strand:+ start:289 stop:534 length:246 start_codon:yes stop_codon:yes gene_type:complete
MFKKKIIQIITPARLHFGFLEINNNHPNNSFGGIGLSIDKFNTKIKVIKNLKTKVKGKSLDKASFFLNTFCKEKKLNQIFF